MLRRLNNFELSILFVLLAAILMRVYVSFFTGLRWISDDSGTYMFMADLILAGDPISNFPNGFPLYIALFKSFLPGAFVNPALIIFNILFSAATILCGILIVKKVFNSSFLAIIVGLSIAFYPNQVNYARHILTEAPTTFFLIFSVLLLLRKKYIPSAIMLFLVVIFRTSFLPLVPIFLIAIYYQNLNQKNYRKLYSFGMSMAVCTLLFSVLFIFDIIKSSDNLNGNLLISIQSFSHNINFNLDNFSEFEKNHPFQTYFQFAWDNPELYIKQRLASLQELWGWPSKGQTHNQRGFMAQLLISIRLPLILLAVYEIFRQYRDVNHWILFSPILVLTLVHIPLFSMPRFNVVVEPFLIILAILALNSILSRVSLYKTIRNKLESALEK